MIYKKIASLLIAALLLGACQEKSKEEKEAPNILFLFADDYTYEAIHALGNSVIETPNLDRLVSEGTTFTHAYNMGGWNGAICVASRAMIISGSYIWNAHGTTTKWREKDSTALRNTWGRLMASQGYNTYMTGKWHVNAPADYVFDTARHIRPGMPDDLRSQANWKEIRQAYKEGKDVKPIMPPAYFRPVDENDTLWSPSDPKHKGFWEGGKHWSEVIKDDALDYLEDATQKEDPFFMYLAFNAPHDPRQSPQSFLDKYDIENIPVPENWLPVYPYRDAMNSNFHMRDEALAPFPRTPFAIKTHLKEYYAIITHLDEQVGKILDALEASGKLDNTYIFFTGDHGLSVGHHGLLGKQSMFDHSIRVPLMVVGPDIPKGQKINTDVYLQDIMATSLELADIEKPTYVEFNSLLPLAKGETTNGHLQDGVYGAFEKESQRMIRKDGFKLIVYPKIDKVLLFNMEEDPMEMHDLAGMPENQSRVKSLFSDLMALQKKMNDPLDLNELYANLNQL
ncbi:sulfatase-like hydrolase/transferase [Flagellimonas myxillae]|uniref:sulfatase-like hydrolase/transferase n=1 Tax=Flagellimonas myxillae TaxID=2942214 RepID=UPI00201ED0E9|nr:sulfatase-like hydrolase/transferase [Muricauda myxillae]MCL6265162.1 sulfatase-like hydrolase/transferase [Muricauda myxillae]